MVTSAIEDENERNVPSTRASLFAFHRRHHKSNTKKLVAGEKPQVNLSMNLILIDFVADSAAHQRARAPSAAHDDRAIVIYHDWKSLSGRLLTIPPRGALCGKLIGRLQAERKRQIDRIMHRRIMKRATFVQCQYRSLARRLGCVHHLHKLRDKM
jgi:hypothetical protein